MDEKEFEEMTKEEMQRFLIMEAADGRTKEEAMQRLLDLLGLKWPEDTKN
ncbi:hypothetical protein [Slackia faecicanis]|nr:hypothetical protein [Slackia faecicanis]